MPFYVPADELVAMSTWELDGLPVPDFLEGWDPQTDLVISSRITIQLESFLAEARVPADTKLKLTVSWSSSTSGMGASAFTSILSSAQSVTVTLPGERLGGTLAIRSTITLAENRQPSQLGEVFRAGSVLWNSVTSVRLDGHGSMFPIGVADFAGTPYGPYASWHLQVSDELDAPFLGTFLLLINSRDISLVDAINQKKPSTTSTQLVNELEAGVASLMIELALRLEDANLEPLSEDSVGSVLGRYLRMAHAEGLTAGLRTDDPSRFRSIVESVVRAQGHGRTFE
ncbi:hypothetical protein [Subtercola sp. RTI3]|uniref:hypothetical protein n=1 Tax=Subtercola sp. RTI3 TaxID=3048639 RepID=UPI002B22366B|nr:hypothetical protein [Subtercola sp. RTI3]MEA9984610.1 hypothetical protein [Subtercola sp. RTI3]